MEMRAFKVKIFLRISEYLEKPRSQYYSGCITGLFGAYSIATGQDFFDMRTEYNHWARYHGKTEF